MKRPDRSAWISPDDPPENGETVLICARDIFDETVITAAVYCAWTERYADDKFNVWRRDSRNLYGWAPLPPKIGRRVKA